VTSTDSFDKDFGTLWKEVEKLGSLRRLRDPQKISQLRTELWETIEDFRPRLELALNGDALRRLTRIIDGATQAEVAVGEIRKVIQDLKGSHRKTAERLLKIMAEGFNATDRPKSIAELLAELDRASDVIMSALFALAPMTSSKRPPGRPFLPYGPVTLKLCVIWQRATGKKMRFPKVNAVADGSGAADDGLEFVRLSLKLLDPTVDLAQAVTSVRTIQKLNQKLDAYVARYRGRPAMAALEEILEERASAQSKRPRPPKAKPSAAPQTKP